MGTPLFGFNTVNDDGALNPAIQGGKPNPIRRIIKALEKRCQFSRYFGFKKEPKAPMLMIIPDFARLA